MRLLGLLASAALGLCAMQLPATAGRPEFELIDVHEIRPWPEHGRPAGQANCTNDGAASGLYALTGWVVGAPRTAHLNLSTVPGGLSNVAQSLQSAYDAWTGVPRITVATDGTVTRQTPNRTDELAFGSPGGSIATTYTYRWTDGTLESDVIFNKKLAWFQAAGEGDGCVETVAKYDVENIATHEFGHVYGLDHPASGRFETMYAYGFTGETLKRSPASGDQNGLTEAYR